MVKIHRCGNKAGRRESSPFYCYINKLDKEFISTPWAQPVWRFYFSQEQRNPPGNKAIVPLNWKLNLLPSHVGLLMLLTWQAEKGVTVLAGVIESYYQGKQLLLYNENKETYA